MSNELKIEIRGFQIIKSASVNVRGITMIQGPTNHGKSALMRAIESALYLNPGTDFINHDENKAVVGLYLPKEEDWPELVLLWEKTRTGSASYVINGVPLTKTGRKGPSDVLEGYGIKEVKVKSIKERLMFWRQMESPFLVFQTPSQIFEYMSNLMENKQLVPVLSQMVKDSKALKTKMISLEGSLDAFQRTLKEANAKKIHLSKIKEAEVSFKEMRQLISIVEDLLSFKSGIREYKEALDEVEVQEINCNDIKVKMEEAGYDSLDHDLRVYEQLVRIAGEMTANETQLAGVNFSEKVILESKESLKSLPLREDLNKLESLTKMYRELSDTSDKILKAKKVELDSKKSYEDVLEEVENLKKEVGVCPTCGRPF